MCGENRLSPNACLTGLMPPPQRIGLSATQNPIELVASYLTGVGSGREPATIVQVGQRRAMDLAIEVPGDELSSVTTYAMWEEIFDKLAAYTESHRSTLVFVNTRKLVERVAFALGQRLGTENVAAHHGSLSRTLRLDAEQRLKRGEIKILVATASLELGIDIGRCRPGVPDPPRARSRSPCSAWAARATGAAPFPRGGCLPPRATICWSRLRWCARCEPGVLDQLEIPPQPLDVLMQQMAACVRRGVMGH